jgi:NAD-dependent deacetylase
MRVTFLTGAGISVASGLQPFRGPGGLWTSVDPDTWASRAAIERDPEHCYREHLARARLVQDATPNAAHRAIAALEARLGADRVTVLTQNVDSLHQRAGSKRVIEIHGSLARLRCIDERCEGASALAPDPRSAPPSAPRCPRCSKLCRYDMVLFDEPLDPKLERAARDALRGCAIFIAVGTSGVVAPASGYAREASYAGARTVLVNVEAPDPPNPYFGELRLGRAEEVLGPLLETLG